VQCGSLFLTWSFLELYAIEAAVATFGFMFDDGNFLEILLRHILAAFQDFTAMTVCNIETYFSMLREIIVRETKINEKVEDMWRLCGKKCCV
jgi:hypothetical protein